LLNSYRIIDSDGHVVEPAGMWEKYLDPEFKLRAPAVNGGYTASERMRLTAKYGPKALLPNPVHGMRVEGEEIFNKISEEVWVEGTWLMAKRYPKAALRHFDPESQVQVMKQMGIDIAFLYPTVGLWLFAIDTMDPKLNAALTRAYNNWLRDFCTYEPQLLRGVAAISLHEPDSMVTELHRIATFGWKAVFLRPNPVQGRTLSHPFYEPFWSECEALNIAVAIHEGSHARLPSAGADRFDTRFGLHACSHPMEQMMAMLALLEGGVLERHPRLRVAFMEAGCGWLPYWLWRLDEIEYKNLGWEVKDNLRMKPSEYFRRQCFVSIEPGEPYLREILDFVGEDNLLFGSDYPHMDHDGNMVSEIVGLENRLSTRTIQKILWDNPCRFYGLLN
jgi:predicted TIM-barrel fold metal-dependent hydrolase